MKMTVMNVGRRLLPATAAALAAAVGVGTLSACSADTGVPEPGKVDVVASFYPLAFLAEQIGGRHAHVTSLTDPGQEPHDLELSFRQTVRLQESDIALHLTGLQPVVDDAIAQASHPVKVDAAALTTLEKHGDEVGGHAAAHDGSSDASEPGSLDGHHEDEESGLDPHVWLDPVRYAQIARGVGKAFEKADPTRAAVYRTNTDRLVDRLDALNTRFEKGLAHTRTRVFITTHAAFGYLAERYGLTEEAVSGLDPESEPSPHRVHALEETAKADKVSTIFYETLVSDDTAKTLAKDAHLRTDVLDPVEGITGASRGHDYFQVMDANLATLRKALGAAS